MLKNVEMTREIPTKLCPECGQPIDEQIESFLIECDHCLSKKDE